MRSLGRWGVVLGIGMAAAAGLDGCAVVMTKFAVATPEKDQPVALERHWGADVVKLAGVDVALQAQDAAGTMSALLPFPILVPHLGHPKVPRRLPIWVEIIPARDSVTFDPRAVRIVTAAGDTLRPDSCWGPGLGARDGELGNGLCRCGIPNDFGKSHIDQPFYKRWARDLDYRPCFDCGYTPKTPSAASASAIRWPTCFVIDFPHPPSREFTLLLNGVVIGGHSDRRVALRFRHGSRWGMTAIGGMGGGVGS